MIDFSESLRVTFVNRISVQISSLNFSGYNPLIFLDKTPLGYSKKNWANFVAKLVSVDAQASITYLWVGELFQKTCFRKL